MEFLKASIFLTSAEESNNWRNKYINFHNLVVPKEQPLSERYTKVIPVR